MANWPTMPEVRSFLRLQPDPTEDGFITTALMSAIDYGNRRMAYRYPVPPYDNGLLPDGAHYACVMHAARLYKRRDTVDGTLGFGDLGVVRVGRFDADIDAAYASLGPLVFG
jgi:hypothetical protein